MVGKTRPSAEWLTAYKAAESLIGMQRAEEGKLYLAWDDEEFGHCNTLAWPPSIAHREVAYYRALRALNSLDLGQHWMLARHLAEQGMKGKAIVKLIYSRTTGKQRWEFKEPEDLPTSDKPPAEEPASE